MLDMPTCTSMPLSEAIAEYLAALRGRGPVAGDTGLEAHSIALLRTLHRLRGRGRCRGREARAGSSVATPLRITPTARAPRRRGHGGEYRAAHTFNDSCRVLRTCASWLADAGYVDAHPLETLRPGRLPVREMEPNSADDQQ